MDKKSKIILTGLLLIVPCALLVIFFNGDLTASATRGVLVASVSSEDAKQIALDYIGHGVAEDATLMTENGIQIYAVDIRHEKVHYVIYVHGQTGDVVRMLRTEEGYQGIQTLPELLSPEELDDLEME